MPGPFSSGGKVTQAQLGAPRLPAVSPLRDLSRPQLAPPVSDQGSQVAMPRGMAAVRQAMTGDQFRFGPQAQVVPEVDRERIRLFAQSLAGLLRQVNVVSSLPAYNIPNYWSTPVDVSARISLPLAVDVNWTTIVQFQVPPGRRMRLKFYGFLVNDPLYTYNGDILFRVAKNGIALSTMDNIRELRGTLVQPREVFSVYKEGEIASVQVRRAVVGLAPVNVDASLNGWLWTPKADLDNSETGEA